MLQRQGKGAALNKMMHYAFWKKYPTDLSSEHSNMAFISSLQSVRDRASTVNIKIGGSVSV